MLRCLPAVALVLLVRHAEAQFGGFDDIFEQAFGGGFGGGHQQMMKPQWPRGVTGDIHKKYSWIKGTTWHWNDWRDQRMQIQFEKDGTFKAPTQECEHGGCKWTATKNGKVYIWWGQAGLHTLDVKGTKAAQGSSMSGTEPDGNRCQCHFVRIHDNEALELEKDLYNIMELPLDASAKDIKKKYRTVSMKYHPDKCTLEDKNECDAKFSDVRDANEILSDPEKKILYDTGGMKAIKEAEKGNVQRGEDVDVDLNVKLEDLYMGNTVASSIQRRMVCVGCHDSKYKDTDRCRSCGRCPDEVKTVMQQMGPGMFMQQQQQVRSKHKCKTENTQLEATIEKGMDTGSKVKFQYMSEQRPGIIPGDVIFTVKTKKHKLFERKGKHLWMTMKLTLQEALLGFKKSMNHLDDHEVVVQREGVTPPEFIMRIEEEGMPVHNVPTEIGSLFVKFQVVYPKKLSAKQKELVGQLFSSGHDEL